MFLNKFYEKMGRFIPMIITFFVVVIGWVFFRIEHFSDALIYIKTLFSFRSMASFPIDGEFYTYFVLAIFFSFFTVLKRGVVIQSQVFELPYSNMRHIVLSFTVMVLFILSISSITTFSFNPFIYFRF